MKSKKGSSTFGLYVLGYFVALACYYMGNAVMAANKLGELRPPFYFNDTIVYGILIGAVVLEFIHAIIIAAAGGE